MSMQRYAWWEFNLIFLQTIESNLILLETIPYGTKRQTYKKFILHYIKFTKIFKHKSQG